ncbi:hypothetical protein CEXT_335381 [Caerostris extrusa]|uniref:Uncharacterized protein n=1 Tax=Caerostris extrusa TaxID=172846 RepID=A0AAV4XLN7_CAEEX|nr:hypothetical protein CEXT_335381 [Caerostris extrusa]
MQGNESLLFALKFFWAHSTKSRPLKPLIRLLNIHNESVNLLKLRSYKTLLSRLNFFIYCLKLGHNPCSSRVMSNKDQKCTEKETPNALRNSVSEVSSNNEKSEIEIVLEASRKASGICRASVVCKIIKYLIFITCFSILFKQSLDFCSYYLTYPITTSIVVRNSKIAKKPAITICNHNP